MESERITLIGAPPSPYTRKMISLLRYRHINYEIIWGDPGTILDSGEIFTKFNIEKPKPALLPTFILPNKDGKMDINLKLKKNKVHITFDDNGPGFSFMGIEKVFDRFYTERTTNEEFGKHSGLGLSISKQIIEAHNAEIKVENIFDLKKKVTGARVKLIFANTLLKITIKPKPKPKQKYKTCGETEA